MSLPDTWVAGRLGDVLGRVETKVDPQTSSILSHFYVGLEHIESHTGRLLRAAEDVTEGVDILSIKTAFKKGDILYGKLRPNLNKVHLAEQDGICSTDIWALRASSEVLPEFALHYLRSPAVHVRVSQSATGANLPRLSADSFDRIPIPLPTILEQQRIVEMLRQASELRQLKATALRQAEQLFGAVFEHNFDVAGATTAWPMEAFGRHTTYSKYGPRFPDQQYSETGVHVLRTTDMNSDGTIRWWAAPKLSLTKAQVAEHALVSGTLVLSRSGTIGPVALFDGPEGRCVAGAYLIEFGIAQSLDPEYVRSLFMTPYMQRMLKKAVRSVAQPNINAPNVKAILIPVPPIDLQRKFAIEIKVMRNWLKSLEDSSVQIEGLAKEIISAAMRGDLTYEWREQHRTEVLDAARLRDETLCERGSKHSTYVPQAAPLSSPRGITCPDRRWLLAELSEFQQRVFSTFVAYTAQPLLPDDPGAFAAFCADDTLIEQLTGFSYSPDRIRRTLSQLAALGLIARITLPHINPLTLERQYLKAFRSLRDDEHTQFADVEALRRGLSPAGEVGE